MERYNSIPDELRAYPNWVCYRLISGGGEKPRKVPFCPTTGGAAKSNDASTWASFDSAVTMVEAGVYDGIGFEFSGTPFFGVDIDGVRDEIDDMVQNDGCNIVSEFCYALDSYTEISQSGNGIHIICRGEIPKNGHRKGNVEIYSEGRYFIMTGRALSQSREIRDCTDAIIPLHEKYIGCVADDTGTELLRVQAHEVSVQTDNEILQTMFRSKNGGHIAALWHGDTSGYTSGSEADLALCNYLAFYCGKDAERMDRMFRSSALMRDKWDRKTGASTYGEITIQKAISGTKEVYSNNESHSVSDEFRISIGKSEETAPVVFGKYTFDDTGNANRFYDKYSDWFLRDDINSETLYFDNRRWTVDHEGMVERAMEKVVADVTAEADALIPDDTNEELVKAYRKHRAYTRSHKGKTACVSEFLGRVKILPSHFDENDDLMNCVNGILNLRTGELTAHDRNKLHTKIAYVTYNPDAECPKFMKFLSEICTGDTALMRYMQAAVGYSMTGYTTEQCVFFLYGKGANGKSTFLNVIRDLIGEYAKNCQPQTLMVKKYAGGTNSDIARLVGARLVTSVEPNEGEQLDEGLVKQLSGDDVITARKLYGHEFEFKPKFKLWLTTNHLPTVRGTDEGIWRRIKLIPFNAHFDDNQKDRHLYEKLKAEMSGILNWALEGCRIYLSEGLSEPDCIRHAVVDYQTDMDDVAQFIAECCDVVVGKTCTAKRLYQHYAGWAEDNGRYKMSGNMFGRKIAERFQKNHGKYGWIYYGIDIR